MQFVWLLLPGWAVPSAWYDAAFDGVSVLDPGFFGGAERFTPDDYAARVSDAVGDGQVILAHSLGSMFALRAAAESAKVKALILFSPFARFAEAEGYAGRPVRDIRAMQIQLRRDPAQLLDNFINAVYRPQLSPPLGWREWQPDATALASGLQCLLEYDVRPLLAQVRCPVLILQGGMDEISNAGQAEYLASTLPDAELKTIAGGGHALPLTHTAECAELVENFIVRRKVRIK